MKQYRLEITENATVLDEFDSLEDAMKVLEKNENEDRSNDGYEPGYYTISKLNNGFYEGIYDSKHGFYGGDEQ